MAANQSQVVFTGDNLVASVDGKGIMTITIDTTKRLRPSRPTIDKKTGAAIPPKSMVIGTSGGNKPLFLPDGTEIRLGLTAYQPNKAELVSA
jgi:hypothetical protein